jgi:hypothetical protein
MLKMGKGTRESCGMRSDGGSVTDPPDAEELEISVFGPGYGECLVVHLGLGEWMIVDSCITQDKRPVALSYLRDLKVDIGESVRTIVATHWDDDHIRGLADIVRSANKADFWVSSALMSDVWLELVSIEATRKVIGGSNVREMKAIMDLVKAERIDTGRFRVKWAVQNLPIFERLQNFPIKVTAYAPSHLAITAAQQRIGELLGTVNERKDRLPSINSNGTSVVLSLRAGTAGALLGADLEEHGSSTLVGLGWTDVHKFSACLGHPKHNGHKIPHHGSANGYHPGVKADMMEPQSWTVTTPWRRSKGLPTQQDMKRIIGEYGDNAFLTASPIRKRHRPMSADVRAAFEEIGTVAYKALAKQGHVRLRRRVGNGEEWRVALFGDSCQMNSVVTP